MRTAIITGATGNIGLSLARQIVKLPMNQMAIRIAMNELEKERKRLRKYLIFLDQIIRWSCRIKQL